MIKTNLVRQRQSFRRGTLQVGDIFGMQVPPKGWVFGRVIRTDAYLGDNLVIYIYDVVQPEPRPTPKLSRSQLLIPPFITNEHWIGRYVVPLERRSLEPGEAFDRHCFHSGRLLYDEYSNKIEHPFEPYSEGGISPPLCFDDEISRALGIPLVPEDQKRPPPAKRVRHSKAELEGPGTITLRFPIDPDAQDAAGDVEGLEHRLGAALKKAKAEGWEGHGFDPAEGTCETHFQGPHAKKILSAFRKAFALVRPDLPQGWSATIRYGPDGDEELLNL